MTSLTFKHLISYYILFYSTDLHTKLPLFIVSIDQFFIYFRLHSYLIRLDYNDSRASTPFPA